jgi:hypothetical protein
MDYYFTRTEKNSPPGAERKIKRFNTEGAEFGIEGTEIKD